MENFIDGTLIPLVGSFLAALVAILLGYLIKFVKNKIGFELAQSEQERLERNIDEAIHAVEEKVRAEVKAGLPKWDSQSKFKWVADYIGNKFPTLSEEEADKKINAILAKTRWWDSANCEVKK